jgi:predicted DNA-binding transcriptional regulator AlpA
VLFMGRMPTHPNPSEQLTDARPVAPLLGYTVDPKTKLPGRAFWQMVRETDLPRYVINKRVIRFRMSEIETWLAARKMGGAL